MQPDIVFCAVTLFLVDKDKLVWYKKLMLCPKCKVENPDEAKFCLSCGASLTAPAASSEATSQPSHRFSQVLVSTLLLALLSAVFLLTLIPLAWFAFKSQLDLGKILVWALKLKSTKGLLAGILPWFIFIQTLAQTPGYFLIPYLRLLKPNNLSWKDLNLRFENLGGQIKEGLKLWLVIELTALAYDFLIVKLGLSASGPGAHNFITETPSFQFLILIISQGIMGPIGEEFFFRGYAFQAMGKIYSLNKAAILSALLFALLHGISTNTPLLILHGFLYAYFLTQNKSLVSVSLAHSLKNIMTLLFSHFAVVLY